LLLLPLRFRTDENHVAVAKAQTKRKSPPRYDDPNLGKTMMEEQNSKKAQVRLKKC